MNTLKLSQNKAALEDINVNMISDDLETTTAILQVNIKAMLKQSGISLCKHPTHKKSKRSLSNETVVRRRMQKYKEAPSKAG